MNIVVKKNISAPSTIPPNCTRRLFLRLVCNLKSRYRAQHVVPRAEGQSCIFICGTQPPQVHIVMIEISYAILFIVFYNVFTIWSYPT